MMILMRRYVHTIRSNPTRSNLLQQHLPMSFSSGRCCMLWSRDHPPPLPNHSRFVSGAVVVHDTTRIPSRRICSSSCSNGHDVYGGSLLSIPRIVVRRPHYDSIDHRLSFSTTTTTTTTTDDTNGSKDSDVTEKDGSSTNHIDEEKEDIAYNNDDDDDDDVPEEYDENVPTMKLFPVYTRYDLEDVLNNSNRNIMTSLQYKEDETIAIKALFTLQSVQSQMKKAFGTFSNLQYYNDALSQWVSIQTQKDVDTLRQTLETLPFQYNRLIPIKVPKYYEEFTQDDDYEPNQSHNHNNNNNNEDNGTTSMSSVEDDHNHHHNHNMDDDPNNDDTKNNTSDFMKHLPTMRQTLSSSSSKQEQVMIQLAQVVEQVLQTLPDSKYEKLHAYTTAKTPQRLILKSSHRPTQPSSSSLTSSSPPNIERISNPSNVDPTTTQQDVVDDSVTIEKAVEETTTPIMTTSGVMESLHQNRTNKKESHSDDTLKEQQQQQEEDDDDETKDDTTTYYENDGHSIDTRVYIMELAASSKNPVLATNLRHVIMAYPHALNHIANCIHMFNFDRGATTTTHAPSSSSSLDGKAWDEDTDDSTNRNDRTTTHQNMTM